eukprot:scaffold18479_cov47-Attheya_sp.AAC.3
MSGTKRSSKSATLSPNTKRARRKVIHEIADHVRKTQESSEKYGVIKKVIGDAKKVYTWLKRDQIYDRIKTMNKSSLSEALSIPTRSSTGGRLKGSTNDAKNEDNDKKERAKYLMSAKYLTLKEQNNGTFPKGAFKKIHDSIIEELGISDKNFNKQDAGQPINITPTEGLQLANSLIDKKRIQTKLKELVGRPRHGHLGFDRQEAYR